MRSQLHSRVRKIEQAIGGSIPHDQHDSKLVKFCAAFGVPAADVPYGVAVEVYAAKLAKAVQGNSIGPVKPPAG